MVEARTNLLQHVALSLEHHLTPQRRASLVVRPNEHSNLCWELDPNRLYGRKSVQSRKHGPLCRLLSNGLAPSTWYANSNLHSISRHANLVEPTHRLSGLWTYDLGKRCYQHALDQALWPRYRPCWRRQLFPAVSYNFQALDEVCKRRSSWHLRLHLP